MWHSTTTTMDSSPLLHYPSTPSRSSPYAALGYAHRPLNSSPLASPSSQVSSPVLSAQARRQSQYKSREFRTPSAPSRHWKSSSGATEREGKPVLGLASRARAPSTEETQKAFLRERFRARCVERAAKARERAVRGKRWAGSSSDGFDESMDCDEEDDDEEIDMQDELFRRIMVNANRKRQHAYRVAYAHDVGSSVDPDMEDVSSWENELQAPVPSSSNTRSIPMEGSPSDELTPLDLDEEELAAYAEEYARQAALEDFNDIPADDPFWNDLEESQDDVSMVVE